MIYLRCDVCDRLLNVDKGDAFLTAAGSTLCNDDYSTYYGDDYEEEA